MLINQDHTMLEEYINFDGMHFPPADFHRSSLCMSFQASKFVNVCFELASFSGFSNFRNVIFSQDTSFSGAVFHGSAMFENSVFSKGVMFDGVCFHTEVSFTYARFSGDTWFDNVKLMRQCALAGYQINEEIAQQFMGCVILAIQFSTMGLIFRIWNYMKMCQ